MANASDPVVILSAARTPQGRAEPRGVAALCIGGGEAPAIAVERIVH